MSRPGAQQSLDSVKSQWFLCWSTSSGSRSQADVVDRPVVVRGPSAARNAVSAAGWRLATL